VYCHYGRTGVLTLAPEEGLCPGVERVLAAVEEALRTRRDFDYLTFSGNGEPALHPCFPEIAAGVRRLRDQWQPEVKLAILSNSTTVHLPQVREALALLDVPIMKLDAGDPQTLAAINRPVREVELETIVAGLKGMRGLVVQSVMIGGEVSNARGKEFEAWVGALAGIRPARVQIYSTDRPVPEAGVEKVEPAALERMAGEVERRTGMRVQAYWAR
jgi:wyosine [tRNA(Phe)-imidazoG37] synthetase (radical SAM superfamily)